MTKEYTGYDDTDKINDYEYIEDKPNWIYTYTGRKFSLTNPKVEDVHWDDLIIPLARLPRSNGHMSLPVLYHLLLCVELAKKHGESPRIVLLCCLHDLVAESYIGDINSVLKKLLKPILSPIESKIEQVVYQHFGVEPPNDDEKLIIKKYDTLAFKYEAHNFFKDDSWINSKDEDFSDITFLKTSESELIKTYKWVLLELLKENGIEYKGE